jgi:hypothetical protein
LKWEFILLSALPVVSMIWSLEELCVSISRKTDYELMIWMIVVVVGPDHIKIFMLDEADEMLSRGFKDQIYDVFKTLNQNIQVCIRYLQCLNWNKISIIDNLIDKQVILLSATMPAEVLEVTKRLMRDPIRILVKYYWMHYLFIVKWNSNLRWDIIVLL